MDTTIGVLLVFLLVVFIVIAVYYFRRQAKALEYVAEIEEARLPRGNLRLRFCDKVRGKIQHVYPRTMVCAAPFSLRFPIRRNRFAGISLYSVPHCVALVKGFSCRQAEFGLAAEIEPQGNV